MRVKCFNKSSGFSGLALKDAKFCVELPLIVNIGRSADPFQNQAVGSTHRYVAESVPAKLAIGPTNPAFQFAFGSGSRGMFPGAPSMLGIVRVRQ